ncbi:MAG: hypothetical protein K1060chlam2_01202, partial [Chlamydiae bacterium]|nr:hypothetical protein [Chlamydiota bacterium]
MSGMVNSKNAPIIITFGSFLLFGVGYCWGSGSIPHFWYGRRCEKQTKVLSDLIDKVATLQRA